MTDEPTVESLQAEILTLRDSIQELISSKAEADDKISTLSSELASARDINNRLWKSVRSESSFTSPQNPAVAELSTTTQMTYEDELNAFLDSAIAPNVSKMKQLYGDRFYAPTE